MSELFSAYPKEGVELDESAAVRQFLTSIPEMVQRARRARKEANSYRVKVGVSGLAVNPYTGKSYIRSRGNLKTKKVKETSCAEKRTVKELERIDAVRVLGMVVIGPMDTEEVQSISGVVTDTLHPCWRCRAELPNFSSINDDTLVLSGGGGLQGENSNNNLFQIHTLGQIINLYRNPSNVADNQDTPIINVKFSSAPAVYDNLMKRYGGESDVDPVANAIKALHLLSN
jgi:hypothetical protein